MNNIHWPEKYLPGLTDNFTSNETIVPHLSLKRVWEALVNTSLWPHYHWNANDITFQDGGGPRLEMGSRFTFSTFGFTITCEVVEYAALAAGKAARLSWRGLINQGTPDEIDLIHAWLIESLPQDRLRILSQSSLIGKAAKKMAAIRPDPVLNAHQAWLDGLQQTAST